MLPEYSLEDKRVLIVGAGRGIGKGIALVMGEAGAEVGVVGLTSAGVSNVAQTITKHEGQCVPFVADATNQWDMDRLASEVFAKLNGLDVLINCVGDALQGAVSPFPNDDHHPMRLEEWQHIIDVNLTEAFLGCRSFGPTFISQHKGSVINISSYSAVRAHPFSSAYDASKAGLANFTKLLALEWAPYDVRVNAIAPGWFPDPDQLLVEDLSQRQKEASRSIPLRRLGKLREVGLLAVYLSSDASMYVTGQSFVIDGGLSIA